MTLRWGRTVALAVSVVVALGAALLLVNGTPDVPVIAAADARAPYVVKLHARWCPVCLVTRDDWAGVAQVYGTRVHLVVFDFTTAETTEASRVVAERLGLSGVFHEYQGETGTILVVDGTSRQVRDTFHGRHAPADYARALDAALAGPPS